MDPEPSRIMLGNDMASKLPRIRGRFILKDTDYVEFQAFMFEAEDMNLWTVPRLRKDTEELMPPVIPSVEEDEDYPITADLTGADEPMAFPTDDSYIPPYTPYSEEEAEPKRVYQLQNLQEEKGTDTEIPIDNSTDSNGDIVFNFDKIKL